MNSPFPADKYEVSASCNARGANLVMMEDLLRETVV